MIHFLNRT